MRSVYLFFIGLNITLFSAKTKNEYH